MAEKLKNNFHDKLITTDLYASNTFYVMQIFLSDEMKLFKKGRRVIEERGSPLNGPSDLYMHLCLLAYNGSLIWAGVVLEAHLYPLRKTLKQRRNV